MATGNSVHPFSEPGTGDTSLKLNREKAVVSSRKNLSGDVGPVLEATRFAENGLGFLAWLLRADLQHVPRHVMQKYVSASNSFA
jgi:hypothetical protein